MLAGVEVALEVHTALNDTPQAQVGAASKLRQNSRGWWLSGYGPRMGRCHRVAAEDLGWRLG